MTKKAFYCIINPVEKGVLFMKINFRKALFSLLAATTISLCTHSIANAEFFSKGGRAITTSKVNARVEDSMSSDRIGGIAINSEVERIFSSTTGYDLVRYNNFLGFVSNEYLTDLDLDVESPYSFQEMHTNARVIEGLRLRVGPSTDYDVIGSMNAKTVVRVLAAMDNGWYLVNHENKLGFCDGEFLQLLNYSVTENYELASDVPNLIPAVVATENVKIRAAATTESEKLDLLHTGESLKAIEKMPNGWYKVDYKGREAYVCGDFVKETYIIEGDCYKRVYFPETSVIYNEPRGYVMGEVPQFEMAEVYYEDDSFYLVKINGLVGYINKCDVKLLNNTYVVVDISEQKLYLYSGDELVLTTDVVTGKDTKDRRSDLGIFKIRAKKRDVNLTDGKTYSSHVDYWMPYNGGEGLHDAKWRKKFGGEIYKKNGSHGCINLPPSITPTIYNTVEVGTQVLVKR